MRDGLRARLGRGLLALIAAAIVVAVLLVVLPEPSAVMLGIALSASLSRSQLERDARGRLEALMLLPVVGLIGFGIGALLRADLVAGAVVYVLALVTAMLLRGRGPLWRRVSALVATPFLAVLFLPAAPGADRGPVAAVVVPVGVAVLAWAAVTAVQVAACALGLLPLPAVRPAAAEAARADATPGEGAATPGAGGVTPGATAALQSAAGPTPGAGRSRLRPPAEVRAAAQIGVALVVAFLVGALAFGDHWPWVVLSAVIVAYLPRGRADAIRTGLHRLVGAAAGSLVALVPAAVLPGDSAVLVGLALAAIGVGILLREVGYAAWAFGVTVALTLLERLTGQPEPLIGQRLIEIVIGVAVGLLAVCLVFPLRTTDVVRSRLRDVLAAVSDRLGADDPAAVLGAEARIRSTLRELDRSAAGLLDAGRVLAVVRRPPPRAVEWVADAHALGVYAARAPAPAPAAVRRAVGDARRALRAPDDLGPALRRAADTTRR
ncbi:FUSC family protein [Cnuibacter physcomitrellae]|uniref:FUSC family protein n=1 Tax=Cnuibacter physcomitrellae TaxID=1619308 RepID=UPI002175B071|nr:FUSC family protein [Cnuibacter physcomitrellae]MCS5498434.1 FUSC family protein [Cnuibacter physcomitrellae]